MTIHGVSIPLDRDVETKLVKEMRLLHTLEREQYMERNDKGRIKTLKRLGELSDITEAQKRYDETNR